MSLDPSLARRLESALDLDEAVGLLRRAINTPSVTGEEAAFADLLAKALEETGLDRVVRRDFLPGRPNVWGWRKGAKPGRRILSTGHTDTVHVRGWSEKWRGSERESPFGAAVVDGELWGRGAADLKAGLCTAIMALRLLDRAKLSLEGDVMFGFVGDEESGEPGTGVSAGMKTFAAAIETGEVPRPDFAIYVEPTTLDIYAAQIGFFIADITLTGRSAYFGVPELGIDAVKAAHKVLQGLWDHSPCSRTGGGTSPGRPRLPSGHRDLRGRLHRRAGRVPSEPDPKAAPRRRPRGGAPGSGNGDRERARRNGSGGRGRISGRARSSDRRHALRNRSGAR